MTIQPLKDYIVQRFENIIGKPDVVKEDGEVKVYFYKQVLETNFGKK